MTLASKMFAGVAASAFLVLAGSASALTYVVNQTIGAGSVTGTITTDGATGVLSNSDFLSWDLLLKGAGGVFYHLTSGSVYDQGGSASADAHHIYFNYSGPSNDFLVFQQVLFSGFNYWCNATTLGSCYQGASVVPYVYYDSSTQIEPRSGNQIIATAGVPEPAAWGLMLVGLGLAGAAIRRRQAAPAMI